MLPIALFVVILCYQSSAQELNVNSFEISWNLTEDDGSNFAQGILSATDHDSYPFAKCKKSIPKREQVCEITIISPNKENRTCSNIKISANDNRELSNDGYFDIISFLDEHFLLVWWEHSVEAEGSTEKQVLSRSINAYIYMAHLN